MSEQEQSTDLKSQGQLPPTKQHPIAGAEQYLSEAKAQLVIAIPFLGIMTMNCGYAFSDFVPTAGATTVGGNKIFFNDDFIVNGLDQGTRVFVLAHEVSHIFLEHIGRQMENSYNPSLWNVATDYCINGNLQEMIDLDRNVARYMVRPEIGLYAERFKGMSADAIYQKLLEENPGKSPQQIADEHGGGSGGETIAIPGDGEEGDTDQPGMGGEDTNGQGNAGTGQWRKAQQQGKQIAMDHVFSDKQSEESKHRNRQTASASISMTASQEGSTSRGLGACSFIMAINELVSPTIPWGEILADYVDASVKQEYTYSRLSRRSSGSVVFPAMDGEFIEVCFGVDTSGSMSHHELKEALSELSGVIENFDAWRLSLISCDTGAHHIGDYESDEGDDITTIDKSLVGGGGTELSPMVEYANDMDDPPNVCIIVTDGYINDQLLNNAIDEIPVIVVITSSGRDPDDMDMDKATIIKMDEPTKTKYASRH